MMLQELGEVAAASSLDSAVRTTLNHPALTAPSPSAKGRTQEYGDLVLEAIR